MSDRDVERDTRREDFVATLRRAADAIEASESFRIQVVNHRFTVPSTAEFSVEHEVEDGANELEFQLRWSE
jgi:amphi-Trp domain-containing protein